MKNQKIVVLREKHIEEINWNGSLKNLLTILQNKDDDMNDIALHISANVCFCNSTGHGMYDGNYAYDGCIYDQDMALIGIQNMIFDAPLITLEEVSKKIIKEGEELENIRKRMAGVYDEN